ncbi:hypothetical protein QJS66_01595 [Kocuria rhizophila]|nr:hypothetical protein QJS66_01595 [Kocuria rhizophila]
MTPSGAGRWQAHPPLHAALPAVATPAVRRGSGARPAPACSLDTLTLGTPWAGARNPPGLTLRTGRCGRGAAGGHVHRTGGPARVLRAARRPTPCARWWASDRRGDPGVPARGTGHRAARGRRGARAGPGPEIQVGIALVA